MLKFVDRRFELKTEEREGGKITACVRETVEIWTEKNLNAVQIGGLFPQYGLLNKKGFGNWELNRYHVCPTPVETLESAQNWFEHKRDELRQGTALVRRTVEEKQA